MHQRLDGTSSSLEIWNYTQYYNMDEIESGSYGPKAPILYNSENLYANDGTSLAKRWSSKCADSHETCEAVRGQSFLPKRVLDLGGSEREVSLYVTKGESAAYATLSDTPAYGL